MGKWTSIGAFEQPRVAFCLNLRQLTIGHLFLLDDLGLGIEPKDFGQAVAIALICSHNHRKARKLVGTFRARLIVSFLGYLSGRRRRLDHDVAVLCEWMRENLTGPKVIRSGSLGGSWEDVGTPLHVNLLACAAGKLNLGIEEAKDMPVKTVRQLLAALGEASGELKLETKRDERLREMAERFEAAERNRMQTEPTGN